MKKVVVFASGEGTNLQAIIDATLKRILKIKIVAVVSNKRDSNALKIADHHCIPTILSTYNRNIQAKEEYEINLVNTIKKLAPDLLVLAGWMYVFTDTFINKFDNIINLHPALPGQFPGKNAIIDAFNVYQQGKIKNTGIMVHRVIQQIDAGETIQTTEIPIYPDDDVESLTNRVQYFEKPLLISSIDRFLQDLPDIKTTMGKVRDIYDIGNDMLCMTHSDRLSAFDRNICSIPNKGVVLNLTSKFWFERTKHIIDNHMLYSDGDSMIVKKCVPFKVEVVVRGFITGNTRTSLWTVYNAGHREYCGLTFPSGLVKNQRIKTVITPTTKGEIDEPISAEEIVTRKLMSQNDWDFISQKALELFDFGQKWARMSGFILVDTKYEFGRDKNGNILLIDELHTCDSSRFWVADTYLKLFQSGEDPEKLDKDCVRDFVKQNCDPYSDKFEFTPERDLIERVRTTYELFYEKLTDLKLPREITNYTNVIKKFQSDYIEKTIIIAGSIKDKEHVDKIQKELDKENIYSDIHYFSAHKNTKKVMELIDNYDTKGNRHIWITVAGRSNALSGVVAANSKHPVIACPPFKDKVDMSVNINSTLQCPSNVPVMTILEPGNVALAIKKFFRTNVFV
jgi:phosphoribosylaminoimidazole-succinocarboxamide synthase